MTWPGLELPGDCLYYSHADIEFHILFGSFLFWFFSEWKKWCCWPNIYTGKFQSGALTWSVYDRWSDCSTSYCFNYLPRSSVPASLLSLRFSKPRHSLPLLFISHDWNFSVSEKWPMRYVDCNANGGTVESSLASQCHVVGNCTQKQRFFSTSTVWSQPRNEPKLSSNLIEA